MASRKCILDDVFEGNANTLIGIRTSLEDYRLVYLLNKQLDVRLVRKLPEAHSNLQEPPFAVFEWHDSEQQITWRVISNTSKTVACHPGVAHSLFIDREIVVKTSYLVSDYKAVSYFIDIDQKMEAHTEQAILKRLLSIPQVVASFSVDTERLSSKTNLIISQCY